MSVNNKERHQPKCELCQVRRPQAFSLFCSECWHNCQKEIRELMRMQEENREVSR